MKKPEHLTDEQSATVRKLLNRGQDRSQGYTLKEGFHGILAAVQMSINHVRLITRRAYGPP